MGGGLVSTEYIEGAEGGSGCMMMMNYTPGRFLFASGTPEDAAPQIRPQCGTSAAQVRCKCGASAEQVRSKCGASAEQAHHQFFYVKKAQLCLRQPSRPNVILFRFPGPFAH